MNYKACALCDDENNPACHSDHTYTLDSLNQTSALISLSNKYFKNGEACHYEISADQSTLGDEEFSY